MQSVYTYAGKAEQVCHALGKRGMEVCGLSEVLILQWRTSSRERSWFGLHSGLALHRTESGGEVWAQSLVTLQSQGKSVCSPHQDHWMRQRCSRCSLGPHGEPLQEADTTFWAGCRSKVRAPTFRHIYSCLCELLVSQLTC